MSKTTKSTDTLNVTLLFYKAHIATHLTLFPKIYPHIKRLKMSLF